MKPWISIAVVWTNSVSQLEFNTEHKPPSSLFLAFQTSTCFYAALGCSAKPSTNPKKRDFKDAVARGIFRCFSARHLKLERSWCAVYPINQLFKVGAPLWCNHLMYLPLQSLKHSRSADTFTRIISAHTFPKTKAKQWLKLKMDSLTPQLLLRKEALPCSGFYFKKIQ